MEYQKEMKTILLLLNLTFSLSTFAGLPDPMACTMDLNQWGHSSNCDCGEDYFWNQVLGVCQIKRPLPCTRDYNEWGNPSHCECYEGYEYDQVIGNCNPVGL